MHKKSFIISAVVSFLATIWFSVFKEILGHLLSALFHWFDATTYLKDSKLKWLLYDSHILVK